MTTTVFGKLVALALGPLVLLSACGSEPASTTDPVEILEVHSDFEYYPGCQNWPIEVDTTLFYPVHTESRRAIDASRYLPASTSGFAARVVPPGPGDDIGTMVIYVDGTARYESHSGNVTWLTDQEVTYDWVC